MAHYMPWYVSPPTSSEWGWHWTMKHFDPENLTDGRREAASHYYPLIGLYDSNDPNALECHVLLMKLAGIDGVIIDWYGRDDFLDYAVNHRNTLHMVDFVRKAGLRFAIMYEDQTVKKEIDGNFLSAPNAVAHGRTLMKWVDKQWFSSPTYLKLNNHPVFMVFGPQYYKDKEWSQLFNDLHSAPSFFTLQDAKVAAATGGFSWPQPKDGTDESISKLSEFYERSKHWSAFVPSAYPRFHDIYQEAGVRPSWGMIDDLSGKTFKDTLDLAIESKPALIQLVTWNDWGEGTQIEPSVEFGYRDLETTQICRRKLDRSFHYTAQDLRLPVQLCLLRKEYRDNKSVGNVLDRISRDLFRGDTHHARQLLKSFDQSQAKPKDVAASHV
ncbi:MAG TPA: glycoside hydrolase family 71/99-like protein [Planktothrix sp.]|jgi:hypothetical protein